MRVLKYLLVLTLLIVNSSLLIAQDSTVISFTKVTTLDSAAAFYVVQGGADRHAVWDQMVDAMQDSVLGKITNGWLASNAAVALSKLASGTSAHIIVNNGSGVPTYVALSGDATISNTGVLTIANNAIGTGEVTDGTLTNSDISQYAAIDPAKLETGSNAQMIVSVIPGVPAWVTISGDATISNTGAVDLADNLSDDFVFTGNHSYPMTVVDGFNTGVQSLNLTAVTTRFVIIDVGQTSGVVFTDITNGVDGQLITIIASGDAQESFDIYNNTEILLSGSTNLTAIDGWTNLTLIYYEADDLWIEVSRVVR